jgi:hypothetical protein
MSAGKSRLWTENDVHEAIAKMKEEPGLWPEIEHTERTTGDFRDTDTGKRERQVLARLHPDCTLLEITDLYVAVRKHRRSKLGLKWV